jgi:hypothetical protein
VFYGLQGEEYSRWIPHNRKKYKNIYGMKTKENCHFVTALQVRSKGKCKVVPVRKLIKNHAMKKYEGVEI